MSIEIYPEDFSTRYELNHAISILMNICYNDIGKIIIVAPANDYNINALKVGNMVFDTVRDATFIIVNVQIDTTTNRMTANGYTSNWLLNKRCIASEYHMTTIESGAYDIVNANIRGLTRIQTDSVSGLTEHTDHIFLGGSILDEVMPFLEEKGLGHRLKWNPETLTHTFQIYKGQDLTSGIHAVVFSEEQGSAKNLIINDDDSTLKNVAYVSGTLTDDTVFTEIVGTATGDERREIWFGTSVHQESEELEDDCRARAVAYAQMELGKRLRRQSFSVSVDSDDFGQYYSLGDIVSCVSVRFGVSFSARITGVRYKLDNRASTTEVILGDPILTALGEMRLNYG